MSGGDELGAGGGPADDLIQPFQVEAAELRGRLIRLGPVVDAILSRHAYPAPVATLLAEALALAAALASALKFDGVFTLQAKGDGPVSMLVADFRSPGVLRGYAQFDPDKLDKADPARSPVPRLLGAGYLAFTVDQGEHTERYQGIVELAGATLADCAHAYFRQSEQLQAGIRVAAARTGAGWRAGAVMLQRLPVDEDDALEDDWRRALTFLGSVSDRELTAADLAPNDLLWRLFHEDGVRVYDPHALTDGCRCSTDRIVSILRSFTAAEIEDMTEDGRITVTCEFCAKRYVFVPGEIVTQPN